MTYNSLTENEEHNIPSQILKTMLDCKPQLFLDPNICGLQYICRVLWSQTPPKRQWSIRRIKCWYHSTRVDLYSPQIQLYKMMVRPNFEKSPYNFNIETFSQLDYLT